MGLELLGERWAMLIVRELMLGPKRFGDLRASLPGVSANVLTQRLEELEAASILVRRRLPPPASVQVYDLTDWGREAEPAISALGRWAARSPDHDATLPLSPVSMMLSLKTMFDAGRAGYARVGLGFQFGAERFVVRVSAGRIEAVRGEASGLDAVIIAPPEAVAAIVYGDPATVRDRIAALASIEGDVEAFVRFTRWFELPPKAERLAAA